MKDFHNPTARALRLVGELKAEVMLQASPVSNSADIALGEMLWRRHAPEAFATLTRYTRIVTSRHIATGTVIFTCN